MRVRVRVCVLVALVDWQRGVRADAVPTLRSPPDGPVRGCQVPPPPAFSFSLSSQDNQTKKRKGEREGWGEMGKREEAKKRGRIRKRRMKMNRRI